MTPYRAIVSKHLTKFLHVISRDIPENYGVTLQGSWAHGEYHATVEDGLVRSFSDVDFVSYNHPLSPNDTIALESTLFSTAESCNLKLKGVSIRPAEEMRDMWKLHYKQSIGTNEHLSEFLQFWTLIGAVEVCAARLQSHDNTLYKQRYHRNKFFLGIWRDLGIVNGHCLDSYKDTLAYVARFLPADICNASYALKLGNETLVPWETIQSAHTSSICCELSRLINSEKDLNNIRYVVQDLVQFDSNNFEFMAMALLTDAKKFVGDFPTRKAACMRLHNKLSIDLQ